jgi:hypothetical protein
MAYGHAERNLALIRQLEAETRKLLDSHPELDYPEIAPRHDSDGSDRDGRATAL